MRRTHRMRGVQLQENVTANVIPMVDIMFLLVLFFMLAADMTQRELEIVRLPLAQTAQDGEAVESQTTINVVHRAGSLCQDYEGRGVCSTQSHWRYTLKGEHFDHDMRRIDVGTGVLLSGSALDVRLAELREEWGQRHGKGSASRENPSEMALTIRADRASPYGLIGRAMEQAGKLWIYKACVAAEKPESR